MTSPNRPPEDAPLRTLVWFVVRRWWAGVHILPWQTVHVSAFGIHRYQEHLKTGDRRVRTMRGQGYQAIDAAWLAGASGFGEGLRLPPPGPSAVTRPHEEMSTEELGAEMRRFRESLDTECRTRRLTTMVNDAKATPIPLLDDLAADIMAARLVGPSGGAASFELLAMLRRRLLTDPPRVSASEIFDDLGFDPDPPRPATTSGACPVALVQAAISAAKLVHDGRLSPVAYSDLLAALGVRPPVDDAVQGQRSRAMWKSVRASKLAAARAGNPASPLRLVQSDSPPYGSGRMD